MPHILLLLFFLISCTASQPSNSPEIIRHQLPNGLKINLLADRMSPRIVFKLSIRTSYRDEPPGMEGIRYLATNFTLNDFESMKKIELLGGWWDPLNYQSEVSSKDFVLHANHLDEGLEVVATLLKRMRHDFDDMALKDFKKHKENGTFHSEIARQTSRIDQVAFEGTWTKNHVSGRRPNLNNILEKDYLLYRQQHIQPSRSTLTLIGAFDPQQTLQKINGYLASLKDDSPTKKSQIPINFHAGKIVQEPFSQSRCVLAYPIPENIPNFYLSCLQTYLNTFFNQKLKDVLIDLRLRPGRSTLILMKPGDPQAVLEAFDQKIEDFITQLDNSTIEALRPSILQSFAANRLRSAYWLSWSLPFENDAGYSPTMSPWEIFDQASQLTTRDFKTIAQKVFNSKNRVILFQSPQYQKTEVVKKGSVLHLSESPSDKTLSSFENFSFPKFKDFKSFFNPNIKRTRNRQIIFLETPHRRHSRLSAFYPLGKLETKTQMIIKKLKNSTPSFVKENKMILADDYILIETDLFNLNSVERRFKEFTTWLSNSILIDSSENFESSALFTYQGQQPTWTLMATGPATPNNILNLLPPGITQVDLKQATVHRMSKNDSHFWIPVADMKSPQNRADVLLLQMWFNSLGHKDHRYGPFTLKLPNLTFQPSEENLVRLPSGWHIKLTFNQSNKKEILKWLQQGADLKFLKNDSDLLKKLIGLAKTHLNRSFSEMSCLYVPIFSLWSGSQDPQYFDQVYQALEVKSSNVILDRLLMWLDQAHDEIKTSTISSSN